MKYLWKADIDSLEQFYKIIKDLEIEYNRKLTVKEREIVFVTLMKEKGIKPSGTEMNKEEILSQLANHGKILDIDKNGKCTFIKKREDE